MPTIQKPPLYSGPWHTRSPIRLFSKNTMPISDPHNTMPNARLAPDCLQPTLLRRSGFRQQVKPGVGPLTHYPLIDGWLLTPSACRRLPQSSWPERIQMKYATFGAGCFWGAEHILRSVPGVTASRVGYMGGTTTVPTY